MVRHTNEIHHLPFLEDLFLKMKIKLKYHRFVTLHEIQHVSQLNKCEAKKKKEQEHKKIILKQTLNSSEADDYLDF